MYKFGKNTSGSSDRWDEFISATSETDIMIEMAPQYTYKKLRKSFDLGAFSSGKDYTKGFI